MSAPRITRPALPRREPQRAWSAGAGTAAAINDSISRAVELGYRVIDEHIKQGQRAAQQFGVPAPFPVAMGMAGPEYQELATRFAQYASDAFGLWIQLMGASVGATLTPRAPATPNGWASVAHGAGDAAAIRLRVDVTARRPVEVTVDLVPEAARRPVTVQALRAIDPAKPKLGDVTIVPAQGDESARLVVRVPDDQPDDLYHGIVVDTETGRLAGTVSIRVGA
jgi:hypothetical protein